MTTMDDMPFLYLFLYIHAGTLMLNKHFCPKYENSSLIRHDEGLVCIKYQLTPHHWSIDPLHR